MSAFDYSMLAVLVFATLLAVAVPVLATLLAIVDLFIPIKEFRNE
jgi:hypothetical protein